MLHVHAKRLLENLDERTSIYTPIIEAIVNSIQSIEAGNIKGGVINVRLIRENQEMIDLDNDSAPKVKNIIVTDNGLGFTDDNKASFETMYSDHKLQIGGKGFGRFTYLKYFDEVNIDSLYKEKSKIFNRKFDFMVSDKFIENEEVKEYEGETDLKTIVSLNNLKSQYAYTLEKKVETIARHILEKILIYFINDGVPCPEITIEDGSSKIVLNEYLLSNQKIIPIVDSELTLENRGEQENFKVKIFKVYFSQSNSQVCLTAHNRLVTTEPLYTYVPEFKDGFYDETPRTDGKEGVIKNNFSIKAYVMGKYLDDNVLLEREAFKFSEKSELIYPFHKEQIESEAVKKVVEQFSNDVISRQQKKKDRVNQYVDANAPWHRPYLKDLELSKIAYNISDLELESELQKLKYKKDEEIRNKVRDLLSEKHESKIAEKVNEIYEELTDLGKSDLAHYVVLRKAILDLFKKSLEWNDDKKYEKEQIIHDIIFPIKEDSDSLSYDKHNLWILDERLSFSKFISSDKPLNTNDDRPDLLVFDTAVAVREDEDFSNPITIFEFKRPQRDNYGKDNPLAQIVKYIEKIRRGDHKNFEGRFIKANQTTPAYGILICDINNEIEAFCKEYSLIKNTDNESYYGYHPGYNIYLEVLSFDKLINNSELRNRIFFKKLGLE